MPHQLAVMLVHGMGHPTPDFADDLIDRLQRALGREARRVVLAPCYWADILQWSQDRVWERMRASGARMDGRWARRWIVSALGDPAGYLSGYMQDGHPVYLQVHERVRDTLAGLAARLERPDETPLAVLAHSLGSVVVSNYVWNEERAAGEIVPGASPMVDGAMRAVLRAAVGRTPFERMETLTTLVTYGANIPLFLPPVERLACIRFPRPSLPAPLRAVARWTNVYDVDDWLGYPLAALWDETHGTVIHDVTLSVGPFPVSATPFSHTCYDRDPEFARLVVRELEAVLAV
ncbi:MAG TPA: hypothetical protein VEZ47_02710 [Gemmatirosa sp.]|nr:hypothetical protein [Gemmatirosa sp.]